MSGETSMSRSGTVFSTVAIALALCVTASFANAESTSTPAVDATSTLPIVPTHNAAEVETKVRATFSDIPVMIDVARCESKFRQYTDSGNVLRGGWEGRMVGVFQIHGDVHHMAALSLGFDINTLDGNLGYARHLYGKHGTDPWISSFPCWNNSTAEAHAPEPQNNGALTKDLSLGMIDSEILTLQKILNTSGFILTSEGPGSPGNETSKFGALTRVAVRKFQCAQNIACSGDEYTTGYGFVGARTRAALLKSSSTIASVQPATAPAAEPGYTSEQLAHIESLKLQIAELQKILAELLQKKYGAL